MQDVENTYAITKIGDFNGRKRQRLKPRFH